MYVPIKTANQHFTVYRIIGLPNRIGKDKFVLYQIDFPYFVIGSSQRDYALLTETELQQCTSSTVTVCPVSTGFHDIQTTTYTLSLYFQTAWENKPCRTILLNHDIPILRRHDTIWMFHFSQPTQVNICCPRNNKGWETRTEVLYNAGIIYNATSCFITSSKVRTLPELHRLMHTRLDNPSIFMPDQSPELTAFEMPNVKAALPASITEIDNIKSHVDAPRQSLDVDTLLHARHVSLQQEKQTYCHLIMTIISCTVTFLLIIYFSFYFKLHHFMLRCSCKNIPPEHENTPAPSSSNIPTSEYTKATTEMDVHKESVTFTGYSLRQTN